MAIHQLLHSAGNEAVANRTLNYMRRIMTFEFGHNVAMSQRLDRAFTPQIFNIMHVYRTAPTLFDGFNKGKEEGAPFQPSPEAVKIAQSRFFKDLEDDMVAEINDVRDDIYENTLQNYMQAFINANLDWHLGRHQRGFFESQFEKILDANVSLVSEGELLDIGDNLFICSPRPGHSRQDSFVPHMLKELGNTTGSRNEAYDKIGGAFIKFQRELTRFVRMSVNYDQDYLKKLDRIYSETMATRKKRMDRRKKKTQLTGNYFVIVRHRTGEALASTSSIGSAFGSHIGHGGIIQNNFNKDLLSVDLRKKAGPFLYHMEPLIVVNNMTKKIRMAYAGPPGHPILSLDMPRKMTALTMSLFYDRVRLDKALTMPLVFTENGQNMTIVGGFPYQKYLPLHETLEKKYGKLDVRKVSTKLVDEAAAVDRGRAVQFMGRGGQIMPNGF